MSSKFAVKIEYRINDDKITHMKLTEDKSQDKKDLDIDEFLKRKKDELEALKHLLEKLNTKNINTKKQ